MLVGRRYDLASVGGLLDDVRAGRGRALVLVGRAGVGKSALLDQVPALAPTAQVVRATGVESEADLAWSGLASLLDPLVDAEVLAGLAPPRAAALRRVLLLDDPGGPIDLRAVAVGTLDVVTARATPERPLVIVVDDLHWLDDESRRVLRFVARRLGSDPVGVIAASRVPDELPQRTLVDLDAASADELLGHEGVVPAALRQRLVAEVGTNPMLLVAAARALDADVRSGAAPAPATLPLPASLLDSGRARVEALDPATRRALLVLACSRGEPQAEVDAVVAALGGGGAGWGAALAADVVVATPEGLAFTHPTVRAAVLAAAPDEDRRAIHAAWAEVGADAVGRAIHASLAAPGPDEEVATALDGASAELARRGALATAAAELERAADLGVDPVAAARRRARAAEWRLALGDLDAAAPLLDRAAEGDDATAALVERLRARALHLAGYDAEAVVALRTAADRVAATDPDAAASALLEALIPMARLSDLGGVVAETARLRDLADRLPPDRAAEVAVVLAAVDTLAGGDPGPCVAATRALLAERGLHAAGPLVAGAVAPVLGYAVRHPDVLALLRDLERDLRQSAAVVPLVWLLGALQVQYHGRSQTVAVVLGDEAISLATEIGSPHQAFIAASGMGVAAANAGDAEGVARARAVIDAAHDDIGRSAGAVAEATLALAVGDLDRAIDTYRWLHREIGLGRHAVRWEPEYVEALARARRVDEARAVLAEADAAGRGRSIERFARSEALLADDPDAAVALLGPALAGLEASGHLVGAGRTELVWGEVTRRARRRAEARTHLERACALLGEAGATPWLQRARAELVAAGGAVAEAGASGHELLTPQELRIARMAAAGASNREIGAAVFLSERTVEAHLSAVYRKLPVRGRRGLAARALTDPTLREPAT
ncbi:MAG TPA: AAA family ATPase [Iamia sp.]|nr:AAA family ATPase [Iamia sp.]